MKDNLRKLEKRISRKANEEIWFAILSFSTILLGLFISFILFSQEQLHRFKTVSDIGRVLITGLPVAFLSMLIRFYIVIELQFLTTVHKY